MAVKQLTHTGKELDEAISRVQGNYADISGTTAQKSDVRIGKKFVGANKQLETGDMIDAGGGEPEEVTVTPTYSEQIITPSVNHYISKATVKAVKPKPQELETAAALLNATLSEDNIGCIYKYTGSTTSDFTNGAIYMCIDDSEVV